MSDTTPDQPSGRFVLRLPPAFHKRLKRLAQQSGVSLNDLCMRLLADGSAKVHPLNGVVSRAIAESGDSLVAVVIFGSYARGTARSDSDIDVLLVVDHDVTRSLYNAWDEQPMQLDGHSIEPHFVRMPGNDDAITSLWAEVATEGAVVFDPTLSISRYLTHVRHAIVKGLMVRRVAQGKPYWTAA